MLFAVFSLVILCAVMNNNSNYWFSMWRNDARHQRNRTKIIKCIKDIRCIRKLWLERARKERNKKKVQPIHFSVCTKRWWSLCIVHSSIDSHCARMCLCICKNSAITRERKRKRPFTFIVWKLREKKKETSKSIESIVVVRRLCFIAYDSYTFLCFIFHYFCFAFAKCASACEWVLSRRIAVCICGFNCSPSSVRRLDNGIETHQYVCTDVSSSVVCGQFHLLCRAHVRHRL